MRKEERSRGNFIQPLRVTTNCTEDPSSVHNCHLTVQDFMPSTRFLTVTKPDK